MNKDVTAQTGTQPILRQDIDPLLNIKNKRQRKSISMCAKSLSNFNLDLLEFSSQVTTHQVAKRSNLMKISKPISKSNDLALYSQGNKACAIVCPSGATDSTTSSLIKHRSELVSSISTLYAILIIVMGVVVPVTASVSHQMPIYLEKGFYLYLYVASIGSIITMYSTLMKHKAMKKVIARHIRKDSTYLFCSPESPADPDNIQFDGTCNSIIQPEQQNKYGSFCLRLGTVGFGAGVLVLTGLKIGAEVANNSFAAAVSATRLIVVTAQMHFIFLNKKDLELTRHKAFAKLGLMHMIATNICEWLQALISETQNEIMELERKEENPVGILKQLLRDASPFLFPCTIEFSLICAVILFEMWKRIDRHYDNTEHSARPKHHLTIDCGSAQRGLFGGILVIPATVLSLIMFFVLKDVDPLIAVQQVTSLEIGIHVTGLISAVIAAIRVSLLDFGGTKPPNLDSTLLDAAQTGLYSHALFGAVGGILTQGPSWGLYLSTDLLDVVQSTAQTLLIKIAWRRRSKSNTSKPGKELITFLIVINLALWTVNTFEKSRAGVRPDHLKFFGVWAWTIITHVSMPLAIFYRFHSAICLFEVWKSCYKVRPLYLTQNY